jgi:CRP-like cAMP-binding protein
MSLPNTEKRTPRQSIRIGNQLSVLPAVLNGLSGTAKQKLRESSSLYAVPKGEILVRTGQFFDSIIFVQSGWLAADIGDVCVNLMPSNTLFLLWLGSAPRPAISNVRVVAAGTSIALLDRKALEEALLESPRTLMTMYDDLLRHLKACHERTSAIAQDPLEQRLAAFLWEYGIPTEDGGRRVPSGIPQQDLASYLGASREELSRKRQLLIRSGYLLKKEDGWSIVAELVV